MVEGDRILPFVRAFYGKPSTYIWEDDVGDVHQIAQGEGGEQGDPLMPLLFCIGQHPALAAVAKELCEGEKLFAYLDDLYIICQPDWVGEVHALLQQHLWHYTHTSLHSGKTKVWNRSGAEPAGCSESQRHAEVATPGAIVWRGDTSLPTSEQGFLVLGVPLGHPDFVERFLQLFLERIPIIPDVQAAWLILSYCASAKSNFF